MLAERSPIGRLRISSLDPEELSDEIIELVARNRKFCPHLHLPLQSGADAILTSMRRRYDRNYFRERVERVLAALPDAAIGTDLIAGFPGETARHFDACCEFVESLPLAYLHVFPYSVRANTSAAKLAAQIPPAEIKRRAEVLRRLGEAKRAHFAARFCGTRLNVLLEERTGRGMLSGYSRNYVRVLTTGPDNLTNHEVEVQASLVEGAHLVGQIVRAERRGANPGADAQGPA